MQCYDQTEIEDESESENAEKSSGEESDGDKDDRRAMKGHQLNYRPDNLSKDNTPQLHPSKITRKRIMENVTMNNTSVTAGAGTSYTNTFDNSAFEKTIPAAQSTQNRSQSDQHENGQISNNSQISNRSKYQNCLHQYLAENTEIAIDFMYNQEENRIIELPNGNMKYQKPLKLKFNQSLNSQEIIEKSKRADKNGNPCKNLDKFAFRERLNNNPKSFELTFLSMPAMQKIQKHWPKNDGEDIWKYMESLDQERWFFQIVQTKLIEGDKVEGDETTQMLQPITGNT